MKYLVDSKITTTDVSKIACDVFLSSYNDSPRVQSVFESVSATEKYWWVLPEYNYTASEVSHLAGAVRLDQGYESDILIDPTKAIVDRLSGGKSLCVDLTGFMRNHILFLLRCVRDLGVKDFQAIYTEPSHYSNKVDTTFSRSSSTVRTVDGFGGPHDTDQNNDILILGVGYDDGLMAQAILTKDNARLVQLHSLPSLSADMYHESLLRLNKVSAAAGRVSDDGVYFCSADDPYVIAETLSDAVYELSRRRPITNLYLCPLATKVQALGFGLFYLREHQQVPMSIILPQIETYHRETSVGVGRTWIYPIHFD